MKAKKVIFVGLVLICLMTTLSANAESLQSLAAYEPWTNSSIDTSTVTQDNLFQ